MLTLTPPYHNPLKTIFLQTDKGGITQIRLYSCSKIRNKSIIRNVASSLFTHEIGISHRQLKFPTLPNNLAIKRLNWGLPSAPNTHRQGQGGGGKSDYDNDIYPQAWQVKYTVVEVFCRIFTAHTRNISVSAGVIRGALKGSAFLDYSPHCRGLEEQLLFIIKRLCWLRVERKIMVESAVKVHRWLAVHGVNSPSSQLRTSPLAAERQLKYESTSS